MREENEIIATRARLNDIYAKHTGQKLAKIEASMDRDRFMTPEAAKEFGLIDEVVSRRPDIDGGDEGKSEKKGD